MDIPYKVNLGQETPDEPHVGWYYGFDNEEGDREIAGPFASRIAAEVSQKNNPRVPNANVTGTGKLRLPGSGGQQGSASPSCED